MPAMATMRSPEMPSEAPYGSGCRRRRWLPWRDSRRLDGLIPDVGAGKRHEFLVGCDDGFAVGDCGLDNLARERGAADEFGDNLDVGIGDNITPVGGAGDVFEAGRQRFSRASRLQTATTRSRKPSFWAICSALPARIETVPEPTLPKPITPTFTSFIFTIVAIGLS